MDASVPAGAAIFLGDSITQGLATAAVAPYSVNYGIGSATTGELLDNLPVYKSLRRAGAVFLLIGINDIGRGQTIGLEGRLQAIADAIPAGVPLVWSAIMPAYVDRADPEAIRQANRAIARTCAARPGCVYVDTGALSDAALFSDGVHPNTAGYAVWIGALRDAYAKVVPNA
jgi:lysophospholipase L1-like esterase